MGSKHLIKKYKPKLFIGIDKFQEQIKRANRINANIIKNNASICFKQGLAEIIPFDDYHCTKVFSLEACQHFDSIKKFISESYRVLNKNGRFVLSSYFGNKINSSKLLAKKIPLFKHKTDRAWYIQDVIQFMHDVGFKNIKHEQIGQHVFEGWDIWMEQNGYQHSWGRNWFKFYQDGIVDYYVITASK